MKQVLFLLAFTFYNSAFADVGDIAPSLGRILLENDRMLEIQTGYRFQKPDIFDLIALEYEKHIKGQPVSERVTFYKALLLHLNLSDDEYLELALVIADCCGTEFLAMAHLEISKFKDGAGMAPSAKKLKAAVYGINAALSNHAK